jgi:hypothetical protein
MREKRDREKKGTERKKGQAHIRPNMRLSLFSPPFFLREMKARQLKYVWRECTLDPVATVYTLNGMLRWLFLGREF